MSIFGDEEKIVAALPISFARGPETGLVANTGAAWDDFRHNEMGASKEFNQFDAFSEYADDIYAATGQRLKNPVLIAEQKSVSLVPFLGTSLEDEIETQIGIFLERAGQVHEQQGGFELKDINLIRGDIAKEGHALVERHGDVASRQTGLGVVGEFVGSAGAAISDPVIAASLFTGAGAASGIVRTAIIEATIGAVSEAAIQPRVQAYRKELGFEDAGFEAGLKNVAFAGAGGGIFGGGMRVLGRMAGWSHAKIKQAYSDTVKDPTPEQQAAMDALDAQATIDEANPFDISGSNVEPEIKNKVNKLIDDLKGPNAQNIIQSQIDNKVFRNVFGDHIVDGAIAQKDNIGFIFTDNSFVGVSPIRDVSEKFISVKDDIPAIFVDRFIVENEIAEKILIDNKLNTGDFFKQYRQAAKNILNKDEIKVDLDTFLEELEELGFSGIKLSDKTNFIFSPELQPIISDSIPARIIHDENVLKATEAVLEGRTPDIGETSELKTVKPEHLVTGEGSVKRVDPRDVNVDAKRFQFKADTDEFGVTERLRGVSEWDEIKSGLVVMWEDADGKLFVADGHQRVALGKRLLDENPDAGIKVNTHILREADGISDVDARVLAAAKNVAEGTGSAVDAAKVLRDNPGLELNLPPRAALTRDAIALAKLDPIAFGMVVNDIVPHNQAALVGRLVDDPELHLAILDVLAKTKPDNLVQAESIVRQAEAAGRGKEVQTDLFGEEALTVSLFRERARVLDKAVKKIRRDKAIFKTLVDEEQRISGAGTNKLDRSENLRQETINARAIELIQRLANSKGPLSDALNAAAKRAKDDGADAGAVNDFISAIREQAGSDDFIGAATGRTGRDVETKSLDKPPSAVEQHPVDKEHAELFSDPVGKGIDDQRDSMVADLFDGDDGDDLLVGFDIRPDGETIPKMLKRGDVKKDIEADAKFEKAIEGCLS